MNVPTTALLPKSGGMFFSDRKLPEKLGCASLALDSPEFWKCIPPLKMNEMSTEKWRRVEDEMFFRNGPFLGDTFVFTWE